MLEMKRNREAGEDDEASAQLALFSSAETLTPVVLVFWGFSSFYMLHGIVPQQMWVSLPVSVFHIDGTGREFHPLQECLQEGL